MIQKWGREDIVGDYVRLLRTLRPDVVVTMNIQGRGGDRAHEATTVLFREAYYAAGDPVEISRAAPRRTAALAAEETLLRSAARAGGREPAAEDEGAATLARGSALPLPSQ